MDYKELNEKATLDDALSSLDALQESFESILSSALELMTEEEYAAAVDRMTMREAKTQYASEINKMRKELEELNKTLQYMRQGLTNDVKGKSKDKNVIADWKKDIATVDGFIKECSSILAIISNKDFVTKAGELSK